MKYIAFITFSLLLSIVVQAQNYDAKRMAKDIEVAEDILIKLIQQQISTDTWQDDVEGKYIEDYGVVFTVRTMVESYAIGVGKGQIYLRDGRISVKGVRKGLTLLEEKEVEEEQLDRMEIINNTAVNFLSNYAFLIGQLDAEDKILLNFVDDWEEAAIINPFPGNRTSQRRTATLTAEALYKDIKAFRSKKISEEEFVNRIQFSEDAEEEASDPDIELLISIINRLYDEDLSETFVINDAGRYTDINGLGTIIDLDVENKRDGDGFTVWSNNGRTWRKYNTRDDVFEEEEIDEDCNCPKAEAQRKEQTEAFNKLYDPFMESFKENLVAYGQTVQSLADDEMLMFRLHFNDFNLAYVVDVSVEQAVLKQYADAAISLEQAVQQVKVKKNERKDDWR
ncbi:MAG: hypothetical protein AAF847_15330 [Bacteroidota bacterium]